MGQRSTAAGQVVLQRKECSVPEELEYVDDEGVKRAIVPFMAGKKLAWSLA